MRIGYTCGVFDLFHVGHLRLLQAAKGLCDRLIVGVSTDALVRVHKERPETVIPFEQRMEIVKALQCVDAVVPQYSMNKIQAAEKLNFNVLFVGSDWKGTHAWQQYERVLIPRGISIIYLPYTKGLSTTEIIQRAQEILP